MDYNYNYSNAYSDQYFTPPLLTLILPTQHFITLTNQVCLIGLIQFNVCPCLSIMNKIRMIITTLHRVSGDTTPPVI